MKLQELLLLKLRNDLQEALMKVYKDTKELHSYWTEEYKLKIKKMITNKTKDLTITVDSAPVTISNKRHQCCARIYTKSRHMESRCSSKCLGNTEYCKTHLNRLNREGYLSFGRYDEKRPTINEKGNPIPWQDLTAMETIDLVVQYQDMNLKKLTDTTNTTNTTNATSQAL